MTDNLPAIAGSTDNLDRKPQLDIAIETLIEYRSRGLSLSEIGRLTGCSKQNVHARLQALDHDITTLSEYKKHKADILTLKGKQILKYIDDEKLQKASAYQLTGMFGIINQHDRLERDQSTSNIATAHALINEIREIEGE